MTQSAHTRFQQEKYFLFLKKNSTKLTAQSSKKSKVSKCLELNSAQLCGRQFPKFPLGKKLILFRNSLIKEKLIHIKPISKCPWLRFDLGNTVYQEGTLLVEPSSR